YRAGLGGPTIPFLGWGTGFIDFDNDGLLDIFVANGHVYPSVDQRDWGTTWAQRPQLFRNLDGTKFQEIPPASGSGLADVIPARGAAFGDRKSTRLNSSHVAISYAVFCLKKKNSMRPQNILLPLFLLFIAPPLMAQVPKTNLDVHHPPSRPSFASSMETKSDHCFHSVLENDRVRVFKVEVPALQSTSVNYHRHDYLVVSLGKSNFEIAGSGIRYPMQMEDGEMQVIKGGASHRIT